jgi:putative peptidoglycan lipid II flippase
VTAGATGRTLARAGMVVTGAYLASRLLGWVRIVVIGTTFGIGGDLDSFFAAFRIPDFIFQLVAAGALSSALIPILAGLHEADDDARAWRVASTVTNIMLGALFVLAVIVWIAAPVIVPIITPGFDPTRSARTIELTRIMLVSPIFLALGAVATSILNARGRFAAAAAAPIAYNAAIILAAVFLAPSMGVAGLAVGVVVGAVAQVGLQLEPLRRLGFRYRGIVDLHDADARQALLLMAPRAIGLAASQLTFIVATTLTSNLAVGSLAAFSIAFTIFQIPFGVIGVPIGVVALPALSAELARGDYARFNELVTRALRVVIFVMVPIAALGIVLRTQAITLMVNYGRFDAAAIELTSSALVLLLLALPSESMTAILARGFYAGRDTRTPVLAAILAVAINVTFAIVAVQGLGLGLPGIALGIAIGSWAEAGFLLAALHRRDRSFSPRIVLGVGPPSVVGALLASGASIAVLVAAPGIVGSDPSKPLLLVESALAGGVWLLVYAASSFVLHVAELPTIVRLVSYALVRGERP